jgi:hypothetical protein
MENLYAVIDTPTSIILSFPKSYTAAECVTQGLLDTKALMIPTSLSKIGKEFKSYNLQKDFLKLDISENSWISKVPEHLVNFDLQKKRKIARIRSIYIYSLEQRFLKIQNIRSIIHFDEHVYVNLLDDIKKSNPMTDTYSQGIVEYANIQSISPKTAYQEIKFMLDSSGLIKIRNYAWFKMYVKKFNVLTNRKDLDIEMDAAWKKKSKLWLA